MNIRNDIANEFRRAIVDSTNLLSDGSVNWNFVEADVIIELTPDRIIEGMGSLEEFYDYFKDLVDLHLATEEA